MADSRQAATGVDVDVDVAAAARPAFGWRAFVSSLTAFSFAVLTVTGLWMLVELPFGRGVVNAVHQVSSVVVVVAVAVHLWYNWRTLLAALRTRLESSWVARREALWALTVVAVTVAGAAAVGAFDDDEHHGPGPRQERGADRD